MGINDFYWDNYYFEDIRTLKELIISSNYNKDKVNEELLFNWDLYKSSMNALCKKEYDKLSPTKISDLMEHTIWNAKYWKDILTNKTAPIGNHTWKVVDRIDSSRREEVLLLFKSFFLVVKEMDKNIRLERKKIRDANRLEREAKSKEITKKLIEKKALERKLEKEKLIKIEEKKSIKELLEIEHFRNNKPEIDFLYKEGIDLIKNKNFPNAIFSFTKAIKLDKYTKSNHDFYLKRGVSKFNAGDINGALRDIDKSIELKGNSIDNLLSKGICYMELNNHKQAILNFDYLLKIESENSEALFFRGLSKINCKMKEEGCLDLSKAGELGYFKAYDEIKKNCS